VTTTQILDWDEPAREKFAYLIVLASENGMLIDMCTFKVTIMDINDNRPVFHKAVRR